MSAEQEHSSLDESWRISRDKAIEQRDEARAQLREAREQIDGPSGLKAQLIAARKGEQIEFRLRKKAGEREAALREYVSMALRSFQRGYDDEAQEYLRNALRLAAQDSEVEA